MIAKVLRASVAEPDVGDRLSVCPQGTDQAAVTRYDDPELPATQAFGRAAASACCARQPVQ